jgi:hypothetical protein
MTYTQHYRATCKTLVEHDFKHSPSEGGQSEGQKFENIYGDTLSFYKSVFTIDAPVDVWESTQQRFDMKNFSFRTVNLYRLAVLYSMKVANPNFLVPTAPPPKPAIQNPKELPIIQKKVILRKNIREKNQQTNVNYGWRNNYRHSNTVYVNNSYERNHWDHHHDYHDGCINCRREDRYCRNHDYDYYGPDYMMGGGLIIIGNPWDTHYLNQPDFGDHLHHGFYEDIQITNYEEIHIDDMADCAAADTDLMGQQDLNDYGAQDLGIEDPGNDLGVHEDMADLQGDNGVDFNNDDFGGDDGYGANDLGNAYDGNQQLQLILVHCIHI